MQTDTADIERIVLGNVPLLDVRAPVEFERGSMPGAVNIPLLDDEQREMIGIEYAQNGQDAAVAFGLENATDELRQSRVRAWKSFVNQNPEGYLYCFRGGLRSKITQQWLLEAGVSYPKVIGGYKVMRSYLLQQFEELSSAGNILVLSAPTGSGKTGLIQSLTQSVDIEGLSLHRGSAFGSLFVDQPSQVDWENTVASEWLRVTESSQVPVMFESESQLIGRISLPKFFLNALRAAPVVELITPTADRIRQIRQDYVDTAMAAFRVTATEEESLQKLEVYVSDSLNRIQKRLGGERYRHLVSLLPAAIEELRGNSQTDKVDEIVRTLLHHYYDPLYAHKMIGRKEQVVFRGTAAEIIEWVGNERL